MNELVLRGQRVLVDGTLRPAVVHVRDGRVTGVAGPNELGTGPMVHDVGDAVLMAGLVDTHVHVNDPGRTEWEGFETATRAAATGGVTTILDMPLNSVPATTNVPALEEKRAAGRGRCYVDVGFIGGVVPGNAGDLEPLARAGVLAFKCFLVESGVDEFRHVSEGDLRAAMPTLASLGLPLMVHAELPEPIEHAVGSLAGDADPRCYASWLMTRPPAAEEDAIRLLIALCRDTSARVHIVHVAAAGAIPLLRSARREGLPITAETCPHYLVFSADSIPDGATHFKCAPPIRERAHGEALWAALLSGDLDMIASDHSPCPPSLKLSEEGNCLRAWGGIASIQLTLSAVWTSAPPHGATISHVARWMSERPAHIAGLASRKGAIAVGRDADFVVWEPDESFTVEGRALQHRHKLTPYDGMRLRGVVRETWLRGARIFDRGDFPAGARGTLLRSALT